ncbi:MULTISPECIES: hypothetical protein [unclassified Nostoc]|nr:MULTISPECIES: hypothetical protein [unclassified Nostoc]
MQSIKRHIGVLAKRYPLDLRAIFSPAKVTFYRRIMAGAIAI